MNAEEVLEKDEATGTEDQAGEAKVVEAVPSTNEDIDRIDPIPSEITLQSGTVVLIEPLRTRQFFRLLRILTRGGRDVLPTLNLSAAMDTQEFAGQMIALLLFAIPEAENEAVEFIQSMTLPKDLPTDAKGMREAIANLYEELDNPELEDTLSIIEAVIRREAPDLKALGERLMNAVKVSDKSGTTSILTQ